MTDLSHTIAPKSDQLNADDLIAGPRTIRVTKVALRSEDQPVAIHFEGDDGKPYKPCKSMRRVLVTAWGADASVYAGRAMTLYRDDDVVFGGQKVGGIRISHLSHIDRPLTLALTVTRASRKSVTIKPLVAPKAAQQAPTFDLGALRAAAADAAKGGTERFRAWWATLGQQERAAIKPHTEEYAAIAKTADAAATDDPFAPTTVTAPPTEAEHPALADMRKHTDVQALVAWFNQLDQETADAIWAGYEAYRDQLVGGVP